MPVISLWRIAAISMLACLFCMLGGCAAGTNSADPWEKTNRFFYNANDTMDRVALKPMSDAYVKVVPKPVRLCLSNTFDNLGYFNIILNDFLQGKEDQGFNDAGRMFINSTIGLAGFFDVATPMQLPAHENDFGITLAVWGAPPGNYMVLPLFGPTNVRDAPGIAVGFATDPTTWLDLPVRVTLPLCIAEAVDTRSRAEREFRFRNAAAIDPYVFTRNAYLQYREGQIHPGAPKGQENIYDEDMDAAPATLPATQPSTHPATSQPAKRGRP